MMDISSGKKNGTIFKHGGKNMTGSRKHEFESVFKIIDTKSIRLTDEFMLHKPNSYEQRKFYEKLVATIQIGVPNFRAPIMDSTFANKEKTTIKYASGEDVACGISINEWKKIAKAFYPEKNSKIGTPQQRTIFTGMLLKHLTEKMQIPVSKAWTMVCDDSATLGYYCDSKGANFKHEKTGERQVAGFCDWGNICKIVLENDLAIIVGGGAMVYGYMYPLTHTDVANQQGGNLQYATAWITTDV